jgi:hypothetical protein
MQESHVLEYKNVGLYMKKTQQKVLLDDKIFVILAREVN